MTLSLLLTAAQAVLDGLRGGDIPRLAVLPCEGEILDLQREQLAEGKASNGEDLRPYYSEDLRAGGGWFLSSASAANYASWKQSISNPYEAGERNPDAPNLFITGKFYGEIGVEFGSDRARIVPRTPFAAGVMAKYGAEAFGLTYGRWMDIMWNYGGYIRVMDEIKSRLYGG